MDVGDIKQSFLQKLSQQSFSVMICLAVIIYLVKDKDVLQKNAEEKALREVTSLTKRNDSLVESIKRVSTSRHDEVVTLYERMLEMQQESHEEALDLLSGKKR